MASYLVSNRHSALQSKKLENNTSRTTSLVHAVKLEESKILRNNIVEMSNTLQLISQSLNCEHAMQEENVQSKISRIRHNCVKKKI